MMTTTIIDERGLLLGAEAPTRRALLPLTTNPGPQRALWRFVWRQVFPDDCPPWLEPALVSGLPPRVRPGQLTGERCCICGKARYQAPSGNTVCGGGHSEEQCREHRQEDFE